MRKERKKIVNEIRNRYMRKMILLLLLLTLIPLGSATNFNIIKSDNTKFSNDVEEYSTDLGFHLVKIIPFGANNNYIGTYNISFEYKTNATQTGEISIQKNGVLLNTTPINSTSLLYTTYQTTSTNISIYDQFYIFVQNTPANNKTYIKNFRISFDYRGSLNLSVYDEVTELQIKSYTALIYNNTNSFTVSSNLTTGYINLTNITGNSIYMVKVMNSSYAVRHAILNSPNTIKIYIPPLTSTIDTVTFSQLDYTGYYPLSASYIMITRQGKLMNSNFWTAEGTNTVYLIRDEDYTISVYSNDGLHSKVWGNYKAIGSITSNIAIMDLGVDAAQYVNYGYTTEWNTTGLTVTWDTTGFLTNLFINIDDSTGTNIYNINTTIAQGSILINLPDTINGSYIGYIEFNDASNGHTFTHKYGKNVIAGSQWSYGNFSMPDWFKNAISWFIVMLFGGSFVYIHRGIGAILTGIIIILLWYWDFLVLSETFIGFIAGITVLVIIYHLDTARRER